MVVSKRIKAIFLICTIAYWIGAFLAMIEHDITMTAIYFGYLFFIFLVITLAGITED